MSFLGFGGFIARLLGANNQKPADGCLPKNRGYSHVGYQFKSMNSTVDRINHSLQRIDFHEKNLYKIKKIINKIERIERYMQSYKFKQLKVDKTRLEEEMLNEIEDLRYKARRLLDYQYQ